MPWDGYAEIPSVSREPILTNTMIFQGMAHSRLVQRRISSADSSHRQFATISYTADGIAEIPIVLVPKTPLLPFSFCVNVPSGPFVLWQKWHRNMGPLQPGVLWIWPAWCRISHVVTRATITYNSPTQDCPTADNVMVNVDLSLTFRIGPDPEAVQNFVYRLGAHRLDELLSAESEEAVRGLVYSVTHDTVNDLREEFAVGMLSTLNSKVNDYGVQIMNVKITDVKLPLELQKRLERTTAFKTKMSEQEKSHENVLRVIEDGATKDLETIRRVNERKLQEVTADMNRYDIERREMEEKARGEARVKQVRAMTAADVAIKKAKGDESVQNVHALRWAEAMMKDAQVRCQTMKIEASRQSNVEVKNSEAELAVAESRAAAGIARAEAERDGAVSLREKRRYELEWERLGVLTSIAGKGRRFIAGEQGEAILKDLVPSGAAPARTAEKALVLV